MPVSGAIFKRAIANMNITGVRGLTAVQRAALKTLRAVEDHDLIEVREV
jgi:hypothetical protein